MADEKEGAAQGPESVAEAKMMLEAIIDATQDIISVAGLDGKLMLVNQAYTRVIGLSKEAVIGQPATVDICEGESMHLKVMQTLEPVVGVPMQVGPQKREVIINAAPVLVKGELKGSVIVAHDVSEIRRLTEELSRMKKLVRKIQSRYTFSDIITVGEKMRQAVDAARRSAASSVTVLLSGESGTGKELFAHAIHHASPRNQGALIRVNCAAIPETLIESELFGYEAGAFTGALKRGKKGLFEEAGGGTIFLDEIGEIPLHVQAKLLRVLQEKEIMRLGANKTIPVDIRVIAATHRDLKQAVEQGSFREDLYYRIHVLPVEIPPLRARRDEFPYLVRHLLQKLNAEYGRNVAKASNEAMAALLLHDWPGNVRELENVLARSMISMAVFETVLQFEHLPPLAQPRVTAKRTSGLPLPGLTLAEAVEQAERAAIAAALQACGNNKSQAAKSLGITVRNLYYKLQRYRFLQDTNDRA